MSSVPPTEWQFLGLNADNWIAISSAVVALLGVALAVRYARRSAKAAQESAQVGRDAAQAGKEAADAARRSAEEAATISQIERERRHDDLGPAHPGEIVAVAEQTSGGRSLFGSITVARGYRVKATGWNGTASTLISLPLVLHANQPYRFHIEHFPADAQKPTTEELRFAFWSPIAEDEVPTWSCPCSRPTGEQADGAGHWELRVPVGYRRPPRVRGF
ncbi:hypothetical protein Misp01_83020 [Microtetraspora sp. NBRC 13810]|uniref:hypothetical protein n=1 Tax=Microtetraspora sp. NBRC 13810 TaxID=3030990 RepID=UPI0024A2D1C2|nr:hypothetical protein [Microtetraspora sp. NBRC 13810]GLW13174.1 hypothetical protein Misp01_83020 [Microtetraspora sp. NBRC 13810]